MESLGDIKESYYPGISSDAIITTNHKDKIISWNPGAGSIFGYNSAEIIGKQLSQLIADPFRKEYENTRRLISADRSKNSRKIIEAVGIRKDGIELPIVLTCAHFKRGDELLFTAVIRSVAKRKRLGEMIQSRNRELNILNKIAQSLNQAFKLDEVLHHGLDVMIDTMDIVGIAIYLNDEDSAKMSLAAEKGITDEIKITVKDFPLGQQNSLNNGQYALNFPLISRNTTLGSTLFIKASEFQDTHIQLIQGASSYLAAAIDNACLFKKTQSMSITDSLTELYNQRYFHNVLQNEIDRLLRYQGSLSLVMLDLDGFKEFNDQYGHVNGDRLLRCFGQTLKMILRKTDYAFRYGGDEFMVILPLTTARKAKIIINRLRRKWIKEFNRLQIKAKNPLEFSAGIAEFPQNAETPDSLILLADSALYKSNRQGKHISTLVSDMGDTISDTNNTLMHH
jgi:diguanylate cyclase (GGDEF)-like protein/PAS domain S-box-containing protein